jgi:UDP-N-acetylmuramate: L-alanyl-gamma-D-glutamyl-meso-diaminopimelate ligase
MACLSNDTDLAIFEGDEYLSSALDPRPKFHLYRPHIAVITGIAWDHVNVFPRYEEYLLQFTEFVNRIEPGGTLIYFRDDPEARKIAEGARSDIRAVGYGTHPYSVDRGRFLLELNEEKKGEVQLFGRHNMQNISAAAKVCRELGIPDEVFYSAVKNFRGAARRLQVLVESEHYAVYHDFAHAPSKVEASVNALRELHPHRKLVVCLELHTYSSLSASFLPQYSGTLEAADEAAVFFDPAAADLKRLARLAKGDVTRGFNKEGLRVFDSSASLKEWIESLPLENCSLLLMSSGNFGGLDLPELFSHGTR